MKRACVFISLFFLLIGFGCESNSQLDGISSINIVQLGRAYSGIGAGEQTLFSGNDILWFNPKTREIKFREGFSGRGLALYGTILFKLSDMELFMASIVSDVVSAAYNDLVLYHNLATGKYYLHNSYPSNLNNETVRLNEEIRFENWNLFLIQLGREGRLKE